MYFAKSTGEPTAVPEKNNINFVLCFAINVSFPCQDKSMKRTSCGNSFLRSAEFHIKKIRTKKIIPQYNAAVPPWNFHQVLFRSCLI